MIEMRIFSGLTAPVHRSDRWRGFSAFISKLAAEITNLVPPREIAKNKKTGQKNRR